MKKVVTALEGYFRKNGRSLAEASALEMFGRDGSWASVHLAEAVGQMEAWEINEIYIDDLRRNMPTTATIRCGDSIRNITEQIAAGKQTNYDVISSDNPHGIYGEGHCEHFTFLAQAAKALAAKPAAIIFLVCLSPYDPREGYPEGLVPQDNYGMRFNDIDAWFAKRDAYYGCNARSLSQEFVTDFYLKLLKDASGCDFEFVELSMETARAGRICFGKA